MKWYQKVTGWILLFLPKNPVVAAGIMMGLFALKSVSLIFPISALFLICGLIFPGKMGYVVSAIGLAVTQIVPYWIGRAAGENRLQKLLAKYPAVLEFFSYQNQNGGFVCFLARLIGLPSDVVSFYMGASHVPFFRYLLCGMAGASAGMLTNTLLGSSLSASSGAGMIGVVLALLCRLAVSGIAILLKKKVTGKW
nr:VTT domain-containing protein [uncultured Mediterraneibacter sp.]